MSSSPKEVLFKDFANEHRSKLSEKYPFLTNQQIQAKLKQSWQRVCQENKDMVMKTDRSPRKSSNAVEGTKSPRSCRKRLSWCKGSPSKTVCGSSKSLESPVSTEVDSGPWYDEVSIDSDTDSPRKTPENFSEDTVKDVIDHKLNVEDHKHSTDKESNIIKTETVVFELSHPSKLSLENAELCTVQSSRLLSSEQKKGDSNFNLMFDEEEKIFL
ncbi:uncharacterized protein LOC116302064 [Actinia tenebrosa]|uniref:Uncharacterized protein LOC116302064 n=1 Tax=Actinia tenebrosa TaxID=6105 RepID=A0A6P8IL14_ACTTE|nr:uncharacterized protein LOC116302064 [Actinia tenebrosa]